MAALAVEAEDFSTGVYLLLGLNKLSEGVVLGTPKVLSALSLILGRVVRNNEKIMETTKMMDTITIFHAVRAPSLSIQQYMNRIFKYASCSPSCFVIAYIYIDRFLERADVHLTSLNVHRLLITSVMIAAKFIDDLFYNNAYYAKVGGVSTAEMNKMEINFLFSLHFRLQVTERTFKHYCLQLAEEGTK
ncbi:hypothetical protein C5167_035856 [Papaver somniferum]|uniref:cyclin-P3-1-like n=1 Tax=Papaver somniferum TaxID=3469 RepID=UPI000E6FB3CF|nr:cyclin-P3-1-like [Papaver somniferum]RZC89863.1 hypothetical protein C5167_035856 [Papaver somniferum]